MNPVHSKTKSQAVRARLTLDGLVQGVGFRPFVFRLANELGLTGWVRNSPQGVTIEIEGVKTKLDEFTHRLRTEKPLLSKIVSFECSFLAPVGYPSFKVQGSRQSGGKTAFVMPDIAICDDCRAEILDQTNRRYRYPFTNCTNCGPRFSIIESLPYDRINTTMKRFEMCPDCQAEYEDPADRRFHAQPIACPKCGPHLELRGCSGELLNTHYEALLTTVELLRNGKIVALKGLGGFQLLADAGDNTAVLTLRMRKNRPDKPLAVMFPNLALVEAECEMSCSERQLLTSPEAPIVLLRRLEQARIQSSIIADSVAPGNPWLGVMLPYTPLHFLLLSEFQTSVVATSGNLGDEPICIDETKAYERLGGIADCFLIHDRPICRQVDDSVTRIILDKPYILRRARGYAPLPIELAYELPELMALGAQQKNTIALARGNRVFVSQHIGDLDKKLTYDTFVATIDSFTKLYDLPEVYLAADKHPDYESSNFAKESDQPSLAVQHHYAHVLSCMAENKIDKPVLGIAWDGTGYGDDGTIWGGEFLKVDGSNYSRFAHLKQFRLPGGEKAITEPWRSAIGLLYELSGDELFEKLRFAHFLPSGTDERYLLKSMLKQKINSPLTSSMGRLFDAVASLLGLCHKASFEGQAGMKLEFAIKNIDADEAYPFTIDTLRLPFRLDWTDLINGLLDDLRGAAEVATVAVKFHNSLIKMLIEVCHMSGRQDIVLTGGCFQNKYLLEKSIIALQEQGFTTYRHSLVPTNDGGISLGQAVGAARLLLGE